MLFTNLKERKICNMLKCIYFNPSWIEISNLIWKLDQHVYFSVPQGSWSVHVCCLHLKMEFRSCARGRQWCGIINYYWWLALIKPRLLFSRAGYVSWGLSLSSVKIRNIKYFKNSVFEPYSPVWHAAMVCITLSSNCENWHLSSIHKHIVYIFKFIIRGYITVDINVTINSNTIIIIWGWIWG